MRGLGIIVSGDLNHAWEDKRWKAMKRRLGLVDVGEHEDLVTFCSSSDENHPDWTEYCVHRK